MHKLMSFTVKLDFSEDRIRLMAQTEQGDYRCAFWMTRRITQNLLLNSQNWLTQQYVSQANVPAHAQQDIYDMYHDQAKDAFHQQQALAAPKPVSDSDHTYLLRQMDIQKVDEQQIKLIFFVGEDADSYTIMTIEAFHQILHILQVKSDELNWQLSLPVRSSTASYALQ